MWLYIYLMSLYEYWIRCRTNNIYMFSPNFHKLDIKAKLPCTIAGLLPNRISISYHSTSISILTWSIVCNWWQLMFLSWLLDSHKHLNKSDLYKQLRFFRLLTKELHLKLNLTLSILEGVSSGVCQVGYYQTKKNRLTAMVTMATTNLDCDYWSLDLHPDLTLLTNGVRSESEWMVSFLDRPWFDFDVIFTLHFCPLWLSVFVFRNK